MTTGSNASPLEALAGLLEERRRYEGWLAQLETRRSESPAHVVERVRSDYLTRLDGVMTQLRGRASDLEASTASLQNRIGELERDEGGRRDERAETELRATVGEFESDHARGIVTACDEAITRLSQEREVLSAELIRTVEVLASILPPSEPEKLALSEMARPIGSVSPADDAASLGDDLASGSADRPGSSVAANDASQLDELAFLQSVVESHDPAHSYAAPGSLTESTSRTASESELLPPPVLAAPRRSVTPLGVPQESPPDPFQRTPKGSTLTPGSMPSFMKDMPTEQVKTLKCQECGTMNYPTEWYCERCGGELAAM